MSEYKTMTREQKTRQRKWIREVWYPANRTKHIATSRRNTERRKAERKQSVDALKDAPCMDCKQKFPPYCMDFDHRPGETKETGVARMVANTSPLSVIMEEIAKCDLVCSNCHRVRTFNRRKKRP